MFFLIAYTLIYVANCAVGRMCIGLCGAPASRYVPLLMPEVVGAYLFLISRFPWPDHRVIISIFLYMTLFTAIPDWQVKRARLYAKGKPAGVGAYRLTSSIAQADSLSGFNIHPNPLETDLEGKLEWLRGHHYSLFRHIR